MENRTLEIHNRKRYNVREGRIVGMYILLTFLLLISYGISFAQDSDVQKNSWLHGVIVKLETMKDNSEADILKCEREIQKSESIIKKSKYIITQAQKEGNAQAERIARQALTTAQEAKRKHEKNKKIAELRKRKAEIAIANILNLVRKEPSLEIKSVVTSYSGNVLILKKNSETIPLEDKGSGYLEVGDEIWTLDNSSVELQFLDGRGVIRLGEYSKIKMDEGEGMQILNMLKGKVHIAVEKMDEYLKMLNEKFKEYKEKISTIPEDIENYLRRMNAKMERKCKVRTPTAVIGPRGTEFLVFEDEKTGTELIVLEGSVELKGTKGEKSIIINAGYRGTATKDGRLSDPGKIDLSKIERWWEE